MHHYKETHNERNGYRHNELLCISLVIHRRTHCRKETCIEQVTKRKVDYKAEDNLYKVYALQHSANLGIEVRKALLLRSGFLYGSSLYAVEHLRNIHAINLHILCCHLLHRTHLRRTASHLLNTISTYSGSNAKDYNHGKHYPYKELCKSHCGHTQNLAHHKLERFNRGDNNLHNSGSLLLYHTPHYHTAKHKDKHIYHKAGNIANGHIDTYVRLLLILRILLQSKCRDINICSYTRNNLLKIRNIILPQFILLYSILNAALYGTLQLHTHSLCREKRDRNSLYTILRIYGKQKEILISALLNLILNPLNILRGNIRKTNGIVRGKFALNNPCCVIDRDLFALLTGSGIVSNQTRNQH